MTNSTTTRVPLPGFPIFVTLQPNGTNGPNRVILSAAKNLASVAIQARFFAALRMTLFWLLHTAKLLPTFRCRGSYPARSTKNPPNVCK